jgi:hypothetical protein
MPRGSARARALVLALLAGGFLLPTAGAEHLYSHRYVVFGRLLDANGDPVPGEPVELGYSGIQPVGACVSQPDTATQAYGETRNVAVTDASGDFQFCLHQHAMAEAAPGDGFVRVPQEGNFTVQFPLDADFRESNVVVRLDHASPRANPAALNASYVILARLWRSAGRTLALEGQPVFGDVVGDEVVNVPFAHDGRVERFSAATNVDGDLALRVPVSARPASGNVTFEAAGETRTYPLDATPGMTALHVELSPLPNPTGRNLLVLAAVVAVVIALVAGAVLARRVRK